MEDKKDIEYLFNLNQQLSIVQKEELKERLLLHVNDLLLHDFNKLIQILYRVDVHEEKLRELLRKNPQTDAAILIADVLIQRQEEKITTKKAFSANNDITDEDKW